MNSPQSNKVPAMKGTRLSRSRYRPSLGWVIMAVTGITLFWTCLPDIRAAESLPEVCEAIPGEAVAEAAGGRMVETRAAEGRCVYIVEIKDADQPARAFVIYRHPEGDFQGLLEAMQGKIKHLDGIGDEAVLLFDAESQRYWLLVVKHGLATFQVSGDDQGLVRKVAETALRKYAGR